jgi:hypothetical protein
LTQWAPMAGAKTHATTTAAQPAARVDGWPPSAAANVATPTAGASTRRTVRATGWGAALASIPADHPSHSPVEATTRTGPLAPATASASDGPTVKGRAAHRARTIHGARRYTGAHSTARPPPRIGSGKGSKTAP